MLGAQVTDVRHLVPGLGAQRPGGPGRRRVGRLGRLRAPDDPPRRLRRVARPRRGRRHGLAVQVPPPRRRRAVGRPRRPDGAVRREAAELRLRGLALRARVGRRRLARGPRRAASRSTRRCRPTRCTWPRGASTWAAIRATASTRGTRSPTRSCPTSADLGFTHVEFMPVMQHPFGGSWGYHVTSYFAPDARFGDPDGLKRLDRPAAPGRRRRHPRLGPRPLRHRRVGAGPLRRHPALRGPQPAAWVAQGVGLPHLQLRPPRGPQLPLRQRGLLARGVPRRRPARGRRRLDALPRLRPRAG